jgi:glycosidase
MRLRTIWAAAALALPASFAAAESAAPAGAVGAPWKHDWVDGAVFYEVFVHSFCDSNGDGKGDLPGLVSKLDYLNDGDPKTTSDLGVDALWLTPIFKSPSYHGYDTSDYETIQPDYGTRADFDRLIREAHRRGVRVVLDLVMNHTSSQHPWFVASASSPASDKRDWYVWRTEDPGWTRPWSTAPTWHKKNGAYYYALFWEQMPDLNYRNAAVRAEMERIAKLWLDRGVDGFRLDAARHLIEGEDGAQENTPETHAFWKEFSAFVRSVKPEAVLVGESWTSTPRIAPYFGDTKKVRGGDELPMNFDFPLADAIVTALKTGSAAGLAAKLQEIDRTYPQGVVDAPFLTNHDQIRVATQLGGAPGKLREAAAVLLTLPGAPFVYYGEELGVQPNLNSDDEFKRTPMPWDGSPMVGFTTGQAWQRPARNREAANVAIETGDPGSLLSRYRDFIALRHRSEALRHGRIELLPQKGSAIAYLRATAQERVLVVHNLGAEPADAGPYPLDAPITPLHVDRGVAAGVAPPAGGPSGWTIHLPPFTTGLWKLGPPAP